MGVQTQLPQAELLESPADLLQAQDVSSEMLDVSSSERPYQLNLLTHSANGEHKAAATGQSL